MSRAFGIVNFAGNNIQGNPMQAYRPTGAISFLGRYRVIDFPISNMRTVELILFRCTSAESHVLW